jgi:hypothetical protein
VSTNDVPWRVTVNLTRNPLSVPKHCLSTGYWQIIIVVICMKIAIYRLGQLSILSSALIDILPSSQKTFRGIRENVCEICHG